MITVNFYKNKRNVVRIESFGHAEYNDFGKDIICAAVSILIINCANSIEQFTDDLIDSNIHEDGTTEILLKESISHDSVLLIDSLKLGLDGIVSTYGKKYLKISVKEV